MKFCDIPGHDDVKDRLRALVDDNRLPHALLLQGPEGSAKFALARAFAQYIHCTDRHDGDSCGRCPSCLQMKSFNHIDTIFSFPVVKAGSGGTTLCNDYIREFTRFIDESPWMDFDTWLDMLGNPNTMPQIYADEGSELIRRLSFTSHASRYKTALMWMPERLHESCANKILKLVEEPFADTVFIMASDNPRGILPTIYSRVQRIDVPRYSDDEVARWLTDKGYCTEPTMARDTARLSEGSLNRAVQLSCGQDDAKCDFFDRFVSLMRLAYVRDIAALKKWSADLAAEARETQIRFLDYCARMLRENFIYNLHDPALNLQTRQESDFSVRFARFITEKNAPALFGVFSDARNDIARNANGKIVFFDICLSVILMLKNG